MFFKILAVLVLLGSHAASTTTRASTAYPLEPVPDDVVRVAETEFLGYTAMVAETWALAADHAAADLRLDAPYRVYEMSVEQVLWYETTDMIDPLTPASFSHYTFPFGHGDDPVGAVSLAPGSHETWPGAFPNTRADRVIDRLRRKYPPAGGHAVSKLVAPGIGAYAFVHHGDGVMVSACGPVSASVLGVTADGETGAFPLVPLDAAADKIKAYVASTYTPLSDGRGRISSVAPEEAARLISRRAEDVVTAINARNMKRLSDYIHPQKGLRLSPRARVDLDRHHVIAPSELPDLMTDGTIYELDIDPDTGQPWTGTLGRLFKFFGVSSPRRAKKGYNEKVGTPRVREDYHATYPNAIVVEYFTPGPRDRNAVKGYRSLFLIFEPHKGQWYLVGLAKNDWWHH